MNYLTVVQLMKLFGKVCLSSHNGLCGCLCGVRALISVLAVFLSSFLNWRFPPTFTISISSLFFDRNPSTFSTAHSQRGAPLSEVTHKPGFGLSCAPPLTDRSVIHHMFHSGCVNEVIF